MLKEEMIIINKIVDRAWETVKHCYRDKISLFMDIEYTHQANPLRLDDLLNADNINFTHDIVGINTNFNRITKQLDNCFIPRFSK